MQRSLILKKMMINSLDPNQSVAELTIAELEAFIKETMIQMETSRSKTLIPPEVNLESSFDSSAKPFLDIVAEQMADIEEEIWDSITEDASEQLDRY
ncbi:UNVERIFIED_CONTAM: hypothetical protein BEN50_08825 [Euhalothece sp. KZN 001]